jgi:hypothetical protein
VCWSLLADLLTFMQRTADDNTPATFERRP